jgi:hypothetical protein
VTDERKWEPVGNGTPLNAWLETRREGEYGSNVCFCRIMSIGDEPEWIDKSGYSTVLNPGSFAPPTHWRWPTKPLIDKAALSAPPTPCSVEDGWQLVPKEPTTNMKRALIKWRGYDPDAKEETLDGLGQLDLMTMGTFLQAYKVLLTAAPSHNPKNHD